MLPLLHVSATLEREKAILHSREMRNLFAHFDYHLLRRVRLGESKLDAASKDGTVVKCL